MKLLKQSMFCLGAIAVLSSWITAESPYGPGYDGWIVAFIVIGLVLLIGSFLVPRSS